MPIKLESKDPPVVLRRIAELESKLAFKFPEQYQDFLLAFNVAVPEANQFVTPTAVTSVDLFFGISSNPLNDLYEQNAVVYGGRLPRGFLAIATAGGGDLICMSLPVGSIFLWDHEREGRDDAAPGLANLQLLASSLDEFLRALQPRTMEAPVDAQVISVQVKAGFAEKFKKFM